MTVEQRQRMSPPDPAPGPAGTRGDGGAGATEPAGASIHRRFASGDLETRATLADICRQLAALGVGEEDLGTIELVLAEALNNITEHAYGPEGGPVEIWLDLSGGRLRAEVRDRGRPIPGGEAPHPAPPVIEPSADLPEGGFGWHIIRCLVAELRYERHGGVNRLQLIVRTSARS